MDRRSVIKTFFVVSAGTVLIPSCLQQEQKASLPLKNINLNSSQEALVAALAETIIPTTNTPGAKEVSAHLFAMKMVDDCYSKGEQNKFMEGLKSFEEEAKKQLSSSFAAATPQQKQTFLTALENKKGEADDATSFYRSMKRLTVQAFTSSKYYLTDVRPYKLVPGKYKGCVPVSTTSKTI